MRSAHVFGPRGFSRSLGLGPGFRLVWLALFLGLALRATADPNAPCYDPAGALAPGYFPCDPSAYITACCLAGWVCYSNAMCALTDPRGVAMDRGVPLGTKRRGACTNGLWANANCGDFCLGNFTTNGDLTPCGASSYCCTGDPECDCASGRGTLHIADGVVQTVLRLDPPWQTATPTVSTRTSSTLSTSSSSTSAARQTSAIPSPTPTAHKKSALSKGSTAGLSVGFILLAALILLAILWFRGCFRRSRRRRPSTPRAPIPIHPPHVAPLAGDPRINTGVLHREPYASNSPL
ncbi:hypothetical protein EJ06DRAFT_549233 [Trichodelitschia bisporula]|uniref:Mid2 domain-containing protein n=1 Tax=Trichodelitschia bisporula TaxID=703511 RepID=A0A6G1HV98_9PEZI|nr:hypothetical protein EJ06DRAFT_549233 [Trichodelitschia bisporula]